MADCKVCGAWFSSTAKTEICPTCERALKRLNGYAGPVVHGQWIELAFGELKCSVCGIVQEDNAYPYNYCPNCGGKMDGGKEDG